MPNKYDYKRKVDHTLTSDHPRVLELADRLLNEFEFYRGEPYRNRRQYKANLVNILMNLYRAVAWGEHLYVAYSRDANRYKTRTRYNKLSIGYTPYVALVDALEERGYVEAKPGFKMDDCARAPVMKATDQLVIQFVKSDFQPDMVRRERELIVLKGAKRKDGHKPLMEFADEPKINRMRKNVAKINAQIASSEIWLELTAADRRDLAQRYRHGLTDKPPFDDTATTLYRVFNQGDWKQGGRFTGHYIQNLPKEYRRKLTIDGEPVCEIDFSGMHLNALYLRSGQPEPVDDVYTLTGQPAAVRDTMKVYVNMILNASSRKQAVNAIRSRIVEEAEKRGLPDDERKARIKEIKPLLDQFEAKHAAISQHFYSGIGRTLMYEESCIAEGILLRLAGMGITCLPIHDSFIVKARHWDRLTVLMQEESISMYGTALTVDQKY